MPDRHTIRPATMADHAAIVEICIPLQEAHAAAEPRRYRAGGIPLPREYIRQVLDDPDAGILVTERAGTVTGFVIVKITESPAIDIVMQRRYAYIDTIAVSPDWHGHGIGRILMESAIAWARARAVSEVELTVGAFNADAIAFYERLGFRIYTHRMTLDFAD